MAATIATSVAMLNAKAKSMTSIKPMASLKNLPKGLSSSSSSSVSVSVSKNVIPRLNLSTSLTAPAIAGAIFSTLSACEPALAVQQIAEIAEGDNRGLALLLPLVPAIAWVLYNILQPALNQINKMTNSKGIIVGLGLGGGLAASGIWATTPEASAAASEVAAIAEAAADNRGTLLLFVVGPAILWVLYNILQPALNQINRMRS